MSSSARCVSFLSAVPCTRRVPAPAQLLERAHVDAAVVEVLVDRWAGSGRGTAGRRRSSSRRAARTCSGTRARRYSSTWSPASARDSVEASICGSRPDFVCMLHDEVVHPLELGSAVAWTTRSMPSSTSSSVGVGHEHRDLDDRVPLGVEPRHLEVDPDHAVGGARRRRARSAVVGVARLGPWGDRGVAHGGHPRGTADILRPWSPRSPLPRGTRRPSWLAASNVGRFMAAHGFTDFEALRRARSRSPSGSGTRS